MLSKTRGRAPHARPPSDLVWLRVWRGSMEVPQTSATEMVHGEIDGARQLTPTGEVVSHARSYRSRSRAGICSRSGDRYGVRSPCKCRKIGRAESVSSVSSMTFTTRLVFASKAFTIASESTWSSDVYTTTCWAPRRLPLRSLYGEHHQETSDREAPHGPPSLMPRTTKSSKAVIESALVQRPTWPARKRASRWSSRRWPSSQAWM